MLGLLRKKPSAPAAASTRQGEHTFDMKALPILSAAQLLAHCRYDTRLASFYRAFGMSESHFDIMVRRPVLRVAEAVQLVPASENNHHCGPGGLLEHTLEVIEAALQIRRGYQLPIGGSPDVMAQEEHYWTYGVFVACLFHDIGKVLSRFQIVLNLPDNTRRLWTPHDIPLADTHAESYQVRFVDSPYKAHQRMSVTLYGAMLPKTARAWLMQNPEVMAQTLASIWGDGYESGVIGEIVTKADRASTGQNTDIADASRRFAGAKESIADRLIQKLRQLLSEREIKLNQSGAMGWVAGEYTYFVCRPLADKLIQAMKDADEKGIPNDPVRLYDVLQEHGFALPFEDGKAIRKVRVEGRGWSHTLTCLKFQTRRLWVPVRLPQAFDGALTEIGPDKPKDTVDRAEPETVPVYDSAVEDAGVTEAVPTTESAGNDESDEADSAIETERSAETEEQPEAVETAEISEDALKPVIPELTWDDDVGVAFWDWLKQVVTTRALPYNNQSASIHFVEAGIFIVTPRIFKEFCARAKLGKDNFSKLQKRFARLNVHQKTARTHHNVHPYVVVTPNRTVRLNGYVVPYSQIFAVDDERPPCNTYLQPADMTPDQETNGI